jgi:hypothetical protein
VGYAPALGVGGSNPARVRGILISSKRRGPVGLGVKNMLKILKENLVLDMGRENIFVLKVCMILLK